MSALSTRDALACGLCDLDESMYHHDRTDDHPCSMCKGKADALIASGAVVDAATLADLPNQWEARHEEDYVGVYECAAELRALTAAHSEHTS